VPDAVGVGPLGQPGVGPTVSDGISPVEAILPASRASGTDPVSSGSAGHSIGETVGAGTRDSHRRRQLLFGFRMARHR